MASAEVAFAACRSNTQTSVQVAKTRDVSIGMVALLREGAEREMQRNDD
jgi:hypothetical protein